MRTKARLSPLAAAISLAFAPIGAAAATTTVTNGSDSGAGSLRDALSTVYANCSTDLNPVIQFSGPFTINLSSALPDATSCLAGPLNLTIDGYTNTGATANTLSTGYDATFGVTINGSGMSSASCALPVHPYGGGSATIAGIKFTNFSYGAGATAVCGSINLLGNMFTGNFTGAAPASNSLIGDGSVAGRNVFGNNSEGIFVGTAQTGVNINGNFIGTLDGSTAAANGTGVTWSATTAPPATPGWIQNSVISGNTTNGISITGSNGTFVQSNKIGTNAAGTAALRNATGVNVSGATFVRMIGNVISGNTGCGVNLVNDSASSIRNNLIGTDATLGTRIPNANGICSDNGLNTDIALNVISGNTNAGIDLTNMRGASIQSNKIGTNAGTAALPNGTGIVAVCGSAGPFLSANYIAGNTLDGVVLSSLPNVSANGNFIGVTSFGLAIGNGRDGLVMNAGACTSVSGNSTLSANEVANNGRTGIELADGTGIRMTRNLVYNNAVKNIDINNNTALIPLPNDPGDGDGGPNNQQNWPAITSISQSAGTTTVNFTIDSTPSTSFWVEFFANTAADTKPSSRTFIIGASFVTGAGPTNFSQTLSGTYNYISLTAMNGLNNDTSELSPLGFVLSPSAVTISPTSVDFGSVATGTFSPVQTVTITSSGGAGSADYVINTFDTASLCYGSAFACTGAFLCGTNCVPGQPYANGTGCTVDIQFAPVFTGIDSGTLYICDNTAGSPHSIAYTAQGVSPPPLSLSPSAYDFGSVLLGTKTAPRNFILFNPGGVAVDIGVPTTTTPDFLVVSSDCTSPLAPSARCNIGVDFAPQGTGLRADQLVVPGLILGRAAKALTLAAPPVATASLSGTGIVQAQVAIPSTLDFGPLTLGGAAAALTVPITNTGNGVLTISSVSVTAPFTLANNCPPNLAPGASCTLLLGFDPSTLGVAAGTLTLVTNAPGGSANIPVNALVQAEAAPVLRVTPTSLGFGSRMVGTASPSQRVTVTNIGGAPATLSPLGISLEYLVTTTCGATLTPAESCFADVAFRPLGFGPRTGSLTVTGDDAQSPHAVGLTGTGCRPFMVGRGVGEGCAP